ncbi:MAG: MFS transporter, partial [Proteobacteria bacterium]|nr:MFS transporter [Pseudomonadota bacterium]
GSSEARIAALITVFIAGNAVLQVVLGRIAERCGAARTMLACALAALFFCLLLPQVFAAWPVWPLLFIWGGVSFGIYTMALIELGERFTGQALIAGNAAFALVWGIGGMTGSPATGLAMQLVGHQGLPASLGLLCFMLALLLVLRRRQV